MRRCNCTPASVQPFTTDYDFSKIFSEIAGGLDIAMPNGSMPGVADIRLRPMWSVGQSLYGSAALPRAAGGPKGSVNVTGSKIRVLSDADAASRGMSLSGWGEPSGGGRAPPAKLWASKVSTVISLVGMTAISSAPQVGIPVMIAGQVLSFVFGHMDDGSQKKPLPTIEAIRATFKDLLAQAHIEDLSEEAYSVWDDYLTYYDKSWETGFVANEETLELCKCVLQRAIALDKPGNLHDNVNKIYDNCLRRESGRAVGLQWIPAFVYAGTIELTCLEASHNLEMYVSNAGRSEDEKKNKLYRLALEAWNTRAHDISDKLVGVLGSARAVLDRRLSEETAPYP